MGLPPTTLNVEGEPVLIFDQTYRDQESDKRMIVTSEAVIERLIEEELIT